MQPFSLCRPSLKVHFAGHAHYNIWSSCVLHEEKYEWLDKHQRAFEELKECLTSENYIGVFHTKRKTELVVGGA